MTTPPASPAGPGAGPLFTGLVARPRAAAVLGATCIAFSGIIVRLSGVAPTTATVFRCLLALPAFWILARLEDRRFGPRPLRERRLALLAGVFFAADLECFHHAIVAVGAGLATVLANLQVIVVTFATWLLFGERPPGRALAAVPMVLLGVVLISGVVGSGAYGANPALGAVLGMGAALAYSGFLVIMRRVDPQRRRIAGPLLDAGVATVAAAAPVGLVLGTLDPTPPLAALGWMVVLALTSQVAGYLFITVSLPRLPAIVGSILLMVQPVATVLFAALLVGERPSPLQLAGVALVLGGLVVASAPARLRGRGPRTVEAPADRS